jgi:hypothetical protein
MQRERGFAFHCWDRGFLHHLQTTAAASARGAGGHAMPCMKHDGWTTGHKFNCGFFSAVEIELIFSTVFIRFLFFSFCLFVENLIMYLQCAPYQQRQIISAVSTAPYRFTITT